MLLACLNSTIPTLVYHDHVLLAGGILHFDMLCPSCRHIEQVDGYRTLPLAMVRVRFVLDFADLAGGSLPGL